MSEWEELELHLARLYAAFLGISPIRAIALPEYANAGISRERLNTIGRAACQFFKRHCDQSLEGDFEKMIDDIRKLALRRNDIAHGTAKLVWWTADTESETAAEALDRGLLRMEYMLTPATYMDKKFSAARRPAYQFNSRIIRRYAGHFLAYRRNTEALLICVQLLRKSSQERCAQTTPEHGAEPPQSPRQET